MEPTTAIKVLIPDQAVVLLLVGAGFALIFRQRRFAGILALVVLSIIFLRPGIHSLLEVLPGWVLVLVIIAVALALLRGFAGLFLGKEAAAQMFGSLAADVVRLIFRGLFRMVRRLFP